MMTLLAHVTPNESISMAVVFVMGFASGIIAATMGVWYARKSR